MQGMPFQELDQSIATQGFLLVKQSSQIDIHNMKEDYILLTQQLKKAMKKVPNQTWTSLELDAKANPEL